MDEFSPKTALEAAKYYEIPPEKFFALIQQESNFDSKALSPKGARGYTQLMPDTAKELGVDPDDPVQNLYGGAKYLRQQYDRFKDWDKAYAAYNAGPGAVEKAGGIPNFAETQDYVKKIKEREPQWLKQYGNTFYPDKQEPQIKSLSIGNQKEIPLALEPRKDIRDLIEKPLTSYLPQGLQPSNIVQKGIETYDSGEKIKEWEQYVPHPLAEALNTKEKLTFHAMKPFAGALESMTSPVNAALMAGSIVAPPLAPVLGVGFGAQQGYEGVKSGQEAYNKYQEGKPLEALEKVTEAGLNLLMAGAGLKEGIGRGAKMIRERPSVVQSEIAGVKSRMGSEPPAISEAPQTVGLEGMITEEHPLFGPTKREIPEINKPVTPLETTLQSHIAPQGLSLIKEGMENVSPNFITKGINAADALIGNKMSQMVKQYGTSGGELVHAAHNAEREALGIIEKTVPSFNKAYKALSKDKSINLKEAEARIVNALEDRGNADNILSDNLNERMLYRQMKDSYEDFRHILEERGYKMRENYFTHTFDVLKNAEDAKIQLGKDNIPNEITSNYLKERTDREGYSTDLKKIFPKYVNSMARMLAFDPVVSEFNTRFLPTNKGKDLGLANKLVKDLVNFEDRDINLKPTYNAISKVKNLGYNLVRYSTLSTAKNLSQYNLARMYTTSNGRSLGDLITKFDDQKINDFLNADHPSIVQEFQDNLGAPSKSFETPFEKSESRNWAKARAWGIGESVSKSKLYKEFKEKGMSDTEAAYRALQDEKTRATAIRHADTIANKTQFAASKAYRSALMNDTKGIASLFTMFKTFATRYPELLVRDLLGGTSEKARNIMERGFSEEASAAETYTALRQLQKGAKEAMKMHKGNKENLKIIGEAKKNLDEQVLKYGKMMKEMSPSNPGKTVAIAAALTALNGTLAYGWNQILGNQARKMAGLDPLKKHSLGEYVGWESPMQLEANPLEYLKPSSPFIPSHDWEMSNPNWYMKQAAGMIGAPIERMFPGNLVSGYGKKALEKAGIGKKKKKSKMQLSL